MSKTLGRNRNTNDAAAVNSPVAVSSVVSTKIADANDDRMFVCINNNNASESVWIKLQAASVDNDKKGIWLNKKGLTPSSFVFPPDNIYTGEICAIADGGSPNVYVTEY